MKDSLLPLTFHISHMNAQDENAEFCRYFEECVDKVWIIKPGEDSNKGNGIRIFNDLKAIQT